MISVVRRIWAALAAASLLSAPCAPAAAVPLYPVQRGIFGKAAFAPGHIFAADFARSRYRAGPIVTRNIAALPGYSFSQSGATSYDPTVAGALVASPSGSPSVTDVGFWAWEARTNLWLYSQQFDNTAWPKNLATVNADVSVAPDGTLTGDRYIENGQAVILQNATIASGATQTATWYFKRTNSDWAYITFADAAQLNNYTRVWFNLATGGIGATSLAGAGWSFASPPTLTPAANGWFKLAAIVQTTGTGFYTRVNTASANNNTNRNDIGGGAGVGTGFDLWQADLQPGTFPTSSILTTSAAAARGAPNLAFSGVTIPAGQDFIVYGATLFVGETGQTQRILDLNDNTDTNKFVVQRSPGGAIVATVFSGGGSGQTPNVAKAGARLVKWAARRTGDVWTLGVDGAIIGSVARAGMPTLSNLQIGAQRGGAGSSLNSPAQSLYVKLGTFSDAEMQAVTQ